MSEPCVPVRIDRLCCPICSQLLRNPVTVLCGHNFCLHCIQHCWDRDSNIRCPECGWIFPRRPELIMNTTLAEMVRDAERCNSGSEKRKQQDAGDSLPVDKRSRTSADTGSPESNLCKRHNRCLIAFCCTDEQLLCSLCATEHRGHKIGSVQLERRRKQEELKDMQMKSKQILQQQEEESENMRKILNEIKEEAKQTTERCEIVVCNVTDSLQRRYLSVKDLIAAQEREATAQRQSKLQTLQLETEQTKSRAAELDRLAQIESDICFLQEWPPHPLLHQSQHHQASEDPLLPFNTIKRAVERIGRQLEELCDKEFTCLFQTDFSGPRNVEPTTRPQFLQYACELTLDPATAHKDLLVSAGDKEVKLSTDKSPCVHSVGRFLKQRQVLCREGLQAERCYYEIEVEGDKAEIALAYKGIERKSSSKSSSFGGNVNSWSLDRSTVYSVSHKNKAIQLTRAPSHNRIGVYLKFTEGTVAFYEVSDVAEMTFLYKVEAQFKESLYPGFWLGEKCCIRICDLRQGGRNKV